MGSAESGSSAASVETGDGLDDENTANGADKVADERSGRHAEAGAVDADDDIDAETVGEGRFCPDVARRFLPKKGSENLMLMQAV